MLQGEAEMKIMASVRGRGAQPTHTVLSDDSDITVLALTMPCRYRMHVVGLHNRVHLSVPALFGWVRGNWEAAKQGSTPARDDPSSTSSADDGTSAVESDSVCSSGEEGSAAELDRSLDENDTGGSSSDAVVGAAAPTSAEEASQEASTEVAGSDHVPEPAQGAKHSVTRHESATGGFDASDSRSKEAELDEEKTDASSQASVGDRGRSDDGLFGSVAGAAASHTASDSELETDSLDAASFDDASDSEGDSSGSDSDADSEDAQGRDTTTQWYTAAPAGAAAASEPAKWLPLPRIIKSVAERKRLLQGEALLDLGSARDDEDESSDERQAAWGEVQELEHVCSVCPTAPGSQAARVPPGVRSDNRVLADVC